MRLDVRAQSLRGRRRVVDDEIRVGELLARHLPRVDLAHHAAVPPFRVHGGEAQLVDAGVERHVAEIRQRRVRPSLERLELHLVAVGRDDVAFAVDDDVAHRVVGGGRARLAHVGRHHDPDLPGRFRILVDERRQPQRHAGHAKRRAQRFDERLLGRLVARERVEHERLARSQRHAAAPHRHVDAVVAAVAIAWRLFDAEQVVRRDLRRQAIERAIGGADDLEDRAARQRRHVVQPADLQLAILGEGRRQRSLRRVRSRHVHQQHVHRDPAAHRRAHHVLEIGGRVGDEPLGQQDQRLRAFGVAQVLHPLAQAAQRRLGIAPRRPQDRVGFVDDVALALVERHVDQAAALAVDDLEQAPVVALLRDVDRLDEADVAAADEARLRADHLLHRQADALAIAGEVDDDAGLGEGDERDTVGGIQVIEESRCGVQDRARGARPDVHLVDRDHDHAAFGLRDVGRVHRLERVLLLRAAAAAVPSFGVYWYFTRSALTTRRTCPSILTVNSGACRSVTGCPFLSIAPTSTVTTSTPVRKVGCCA